MTSGSLQARRACFAGASDFARIERAIGWLERNAPLQPSLAEAAREAGLSPSHFQRLFSRWVGLSPKRFLQGLTLEHAKVWLERSLPLVETAAAVGLSGGGRLHDLFVVSEALTPGQYKARGEGLMIRFGAGPSPFGLCVVAWTERGLCSVRFAEAGLTLAAVGGDLLREYPRARVVAAGAREAAALCARIFVAGATSALGAAPLRVLLRGTRFQLQVWRALLQLPEGAVTSYGALAARIGCPRAVRALASAVGANPLGYLIPCHRVLRASGAIGGYRWGVARKRLMLAREDPELRGGVEQGGRSAQAGGA
ncbi:MAG: methylated-DNA--[protein]-cysteine S-methyltransferase [Proteobacteria bacterium]|nr:methylated-DNA--[protein]-cysteine S-methyltransferase [Pseudomonadota bacterium]